jgi:protein SCO1/2
MRVFLRAAVAFVAGFVFAALGGCRDGAQPEASVTSVASATVAAPAPSPLPSPSQSVSIYPLDVALRDQDGAAVGVDLFRGHPVIISMFFGSCPAACPLLVTHIKQIEASLAPEVRADLRVLLVSFDAERDTPDALRELARAHKVDPARWRFASATDEHARVLGNALGINFRRVEGGMFTHDSVITVLDGDGRVIVRTDDLAADPTPLELAISHLGHAHE